MKGASYLRTKIQKVTNERTKMEENAEKFVLFAISRFKKGYGKYRTVDQWNEEDKVRARQIDCQSLGRHSNRMNRYQIYQFMLNIRDMIKTSVVFFKFHKTSSFRFLTRRS